MIQERIGGLLQRRKRIVNPKTGGLSHRKPPNYERPIGGKGCDTVSSPCTRVPDLTTDEFIRHVKSKSIVDLLERKYRNQYQRIKAELKP
jgi:hypothetical protein